MLGRFGGIAMTDGYGAYKALDNNAAERDPQVRHFKIQPRPSGAPHGTPARSFPGGAAFLGPEGEPPFRKTTSAAYTVSRHAVAGALAEGCHSSLFP